jgi:hypothetical protein
MVAVVVVVIMVPVATTVTTLLLGVILVVGTDATATGGITTASKAMVDSLEMPAVAASTDMNRVEEEEAVGGVWGDIRARTLRLERAEESEGETISFLKAIGRVLILRKCHFIFFPTRAAAHSHPMCSSQVPQHELCSPHGVQQVWQRSPT